MEHDESPPKQVATVAEDAQIAETQNGGAEMQQRPHLHEEEFFST